MDRRDVLRIALLSASALAARSGVSSESKRDRTKARLAALERERGGRLGVAILDTGNRRHAEHRANERFLMCSTFKVLAVAAVLARVDRGEESLDRRIVFDQTVVLAYAPVTSQRSGGQGMTVSELCAAAITVSDNTAANLLLTSLGGPAVVTSLARQLGDEVTRLDRVEPELNVSTGKDDVRDTTTPAAMLADLQKILLGRTLSAASRNQLIAWLRSSITGNHRIRAGIPAHWEIGDKTGSGSHGESNDVAIIWPPEREPLLVSAYYANWTMDDAGRNEVLAEVGRIACQIEEDMLP